MRQLYLLGLSIVIMSLSSCFERPDDKHKTVVAQEPLPHISYQLPDSTAMDSLLLRATILYNTGKLDSAKTLYLNTLYLRRKDTGTARGYYKLGIIYQGENNYDSALYFLNRGRIILEKQKIKENKGLSACIYATIGTVYYRQMRLDSAAVWFYRGIAALPMQKDIPGQDAFWVYSTVGTFWNNIGKLDLAQTYLTKAEGIALHLKDTALLLEVQNRKACFYLQKDHLDSAIPIYEKILQNKKALVSTQLDACYNMGTIYALARHKNQPEKAIPYYEKALRISKANKTQQFQKAEFLLGLAVAYLNIGLEKSDSRYYSKAEHIFSSIDTFQSKTELAGNLKYFYGNYAYTYYLLKNYKKSAETFMQAVKIRDSLYTHESISRINESEIQYRTAEKDKLLAQNQLQIARQQNKIQRQYLWIIGIGSVAIISVLILWGLLRRKQHRTEMARLKDIMVGEEKERVRLAHELHDGIVSQLSAIKMNFSALPVQHPDMNQASEDFQSALQQLEQSIAELRTTSHNMLPVILEQAGLSGAVDIYCQKISRMTGCTVEFMMIGALPALKQDFQLTVYRIIQELLQNIIKHSGATNALIQFNTDQGALYMTIDDNGSGTPPLQWSNQNGIGLFSLRERVATINGKMDIEAEPGKGTSVYLSFDLKNNIEKA